VSHLPLPRISAEIAKIKEYPVLPNLPLNIKISTKALRQKVRINKYPAKYTRCTNLEVFYCNPITYDLTDSSTTSSLHSFELKMSIRPEFLERRNSRMHETQAQFHTFRSAMTISIHHSLVGCFTRKWTVWEL